MSMIIVYGKFTFGNHFISLIYFGSGVVKR